VTVFIIACANFFGSNTALSLRIRQHLRALMSPAASHVNITVETIGDNSELGYIPFTRTIDFEIMAVTQ
jgi:hypothetical protein